MEEYKDFLGATINVGDRAIRVHSSGHWKEFKKVTVVKIDGTRKPDSIGIITDGNEKIGWTYPERIIVQKSFKVKI
jgi:hypothetical protein